MDFVQEGTSFTRLPIPTSRESFYYNFICILSGSGHHILLPHPYTLTPGICYKWSLLHLLVCYLFLHIYLCLVYILYTFTCMNAPPTCATDTHRTGNFCGWKFLLFRDSMYYLNISQLLFTRLEVTAKNSLLSSSPTGVLHKTHGRQRDGGA